MTPREAVVEHLKSKGVRIIPQTYTDNSTHMFKILRGPQVPGRDHILHLHVYSCYLSCVGLDRNCRFMLEFANPAFFDLLSHFLESGECKLSKA